MGAEGGRATTGPAATLSIADRVGWFRDHAPDPASAQVGTVRAEEYALSPRTRSSRRRGRPGPLRGTRITVGREGLSVGVDVAIHTEPEGPHLFKTPGRDLASHNRTEQLARGAGTAYVGVHPRPDAGLTRRTPHRRDPGGGPLLLKDLHHRADGVLVRSGDVQDDEPGFDDALLIDLHASTDGSTRLAGSPIAGRQPVRGTPAADTLGADRAGCGVAVDREGRPCSAGRIGRVAPVSWGAVPTPSGTAPRPEVLACRAHPWSRRLPSPGDQHVPGVLPSDRAVSPVSRQEGPVRRCRLPGDDAFEAGAEPASLAAGCGAGACGEGCGDSLGSPGSDPALTCPDVRTRAYAPVPCARRASASAAAAVSAGPAPQPSPGPTRPRCPMV